MLIRPTRPRRLLAPMLLVTSLVAVAAVVLGATAANATTLFSDDFEQPTANVWQTGGGGSWSVVSEGGSKVFRQSNTAVDTVAWAGSGSGAFTVVTAKVKPNSSGGTVALLSRVANPNNFYYVGLRANRLEIGLRSGTITALKSTPFTAVAGNWYTLTLNLFITGTITGSVTPVAGGYGATVSAPDPGATPYFGTKVGFWTVNASASFDNITLSDDRVTPPTSAPPTSAPPTSGASPSSAACPVTVTYLIASQWPTGFQGQVTLKNISTATIPANWVVTFRFTNGETITTLFSAGSWTQVGPLVTVNGPVWGALAPGGTLQFGFLAWLGSGPRAIADVTFNGVRC